MATPETYREYASIKEQIALLQERLEPLTEAIKADLEANPDDNGKPACTTNLGTFYVKKQHTYWEYSAAVDNIEDELQRQQEKERNDGTAKILKETKALVFKPLKD